MWRTLWTQTECVEPMSIIQLSKYNKSFFSVYPAEEKKYTKGVILKNDFVPIIKVNRDKNSFIFGALFYCMDILMDISNFVLLGTKKWTDILGWHEGKYIMTEFSLLGKFLPLTGLSGQCNVGKVNHADNKPEHYQVDRLLKKMFQVLLCKYLEHKETHLTCSCSLASLLMHLLQIKICHSCILQNVYASIVLAF